MSKQQQSSSSSQIHILPPLDRRYHNLPSPVIHPPGSDPISFLNPNPHRRQVLETESPMDVDACVVDSRREEFVAKRFDLTASEHAGVSLNEAPAMVSTASYRPTNSAVVAPQTVKDPVTTKTGSKNTSFISYDVCNITTYPVTANNEMNFKKHMEGKIDLRNTQKPTCSSTNNQETPSPVTNDILDQEPEKNKKKQDSDTTQKLLVSTAIEQETPSTVAKNQDLLRKEAAFNSLFVCDIPEPGRDYPKIATVEMDESLFTTGVPNPTSASTQNIPTKCYDKHIVGKQHKNNLNISEKTLTPPGTTWCEICKVTCTNNDYNKHLSGKKHIKNLQKLEKIPNSPSTVIDSVTTPIAEKLTQTKGEVVNPNEARRCDLCGVCCTSTDMFNEHISGKKHQKKLKKSEKQCVPGPARVAKTWSPDPINEEGEVVFLESSKRKANGSSASEEDATDDAKRQKVNEEEEGCGVLVMCKGCNVVCNGLMAYKTHSCRQALNIGQWH